MGEGSGDGLSVSAVIITRNRKSTLGTVLDRLAELPLREVIVVDNGSEDGTADAIRSRDGVRLIEAEANLGLEGRHRGPKAAADDLPGMRDDASFPLPEPI